MLVYLFQYIFFYHIYVFVFFSQKPAKRKQERRHWCDEMWGCVASAATAFQRAVQGGGVAFPILCPGTKFMIPLSHNFSGSYFDFV